MKSPLYACSFCRKPLKKRYLAKTAHFHACQKCYDKWKTRLYATLTPQESN